MLRHDDFVISALLEAGLVGRTVLDAAARFAAESGVPVTAALVSQGAVSARDLALVQAEVSEYPYVDPSHYEIDYGNCAMLARATAEVLTAFPLFRFKDSATVLMANPLDLKAVDQLRALLKVDVDPVIGEPETIKALIDRAYALAGDSASATSAPKSPAGSEQAGGGGSSGASAADPRRAAAAADDATAREPIVAAVNQIIAQGIDLNASDIHIGPDEHELHLRYRVDGVLRPQQGPSISAHQGLIQRLKVMANLDLTQTRRPQDGKFRFSHNGRTVDLRLSIIPTVCGENAVLRILASGATIRGFAELGFPTTEIAWFEEVIHSPHGMILVTGPTGSGKTTTLYTALKRLNAPDLNIVTIEDPVEIRMPLLRQVQVNAEIGMTFAGALRSLLRQDPDVVFVGEIRDEETARISIQAALTGHLVLSSLHTNDACGAIPRLRDLGCPNFAINAALLSVIAQRLVRRVCADCAQIDRPDAAALARFGVAGGDGKFLRGSGCARCARAGYRGRLGVYEVLRMNAPLQAAVEQGVSATGIRALAERMGMVPMWRDGLEKAKAGLTTLEEIAKVVFVQATEEPKAAPAAAPSTMGGIEQTPSFHRAA